MKKNIIIPIIGIGLLSGCSSFSEQEDTSKLTNKKDYEQLIVENRKMTHENMLITAEKAYQTQQAIFEVMNAIALSDKNMSAEDIRQAEWQNTYIPEGMERDISVDWDAYPEEILKLLANASDYEVVFRGKPYPVAKTVSVDDKPKPIKRVIDDVAMQSKGYIDSVDIFEDSRLIVVKYSQ